MLAKLSSKSFESREPLTTQLPLQSWTNVGHVVGLHVTFQSLNAKAEPDEQVTAQRFKQTSHDDGTVSARFAN